MDCSPRALSDSSRRSSPDSSRLPPGAVLSVTQNSHGLGLVPSVATVAPRGSPKETTGVEAGTTQLGGDARRTMSVA
jgi:hypothetical protein